MSSNSAIFSVVARRIPAIWDVIEPYAFDPMEAGSEAALNPQPLPPSPTPESVGAHFGLELARLAFTADKLGQKLKPLKEWADDPSLRAPEWFFRWPRWPHGPVVKGETGYTEAQTGYLLGLAGVLACASQGEFISAALDTVVDELVRIQGDAAD